jgi:hypothetical protein
VSGGCAYHLHLARSTVYACCAATGCCGIWTRPPAWPVRRPDPARYEHAAPGDLVHVDIKKLGRIPDGGGHRKLGRAIGKRNNKMMGGGGYAFLHHAVDDHSRLAYSELLADERKGTAAGFWGRAKYLLRRSWDPRQTGPHRQRILLSFQGFR